MMKRSLLSLAVATTVASGSVAAGDLYLGGNLGFLLWDEDRFAGASNGDALTGGGQIGYEFNDTYAVELSSHSSLTGPDADLYSLSGYRFFGDRSEWSTYLVGGVSYGDPHKFTYANDDSTSLHLGLGTAKFLSEKLELRGDIRAYGSVDESQNFGSADSLFDLGINLAINYHFGQSSAPRAVSAPEPAPVREARPEPAAAAPAPAPEPEFVNRTIELDVKFNTNEDSVISYGTEIERIGQAMADNPDLDLTLEGHTDSRGAAEYNRDLSQRRANTVKTYLVDNYGIAADRIRALGYGEERPTASNDTAEGRAKNRRVTGALNWREKVE